MITSADIEEIVSKLSSDKAKVREDGIKLLNTWLEGERVTSFCRYLSQNTAKLQPDELFQAETWPFIVKLLTQCAILEISSSKRRLPKLIFAKTLRVVVQKTEETKYSGMILPLLCVVKSLFNHIWDVLSKVSSFQAEYGIVLRHLLSVRDYRFHLRKRLYNSLVLFYMEKVAASLREKNDNQYNSKEELFRNILTLHSLFENPPGDIPTNVREDIVKGIGEIFSFIRDEGKVSRKLIECVNTYLVKDGPNLGCYTIEIHNAVQQFVFRCWVTTHDRVLKDTLIFYARLQLHYIRGSEDKIHLIEQLLDLIYKELNQYNLLSSGLWSDGAKEDKIGSLNSSLCGLVELSATVIQQACSTPIKALPTEKRVKKEHVSIHLKEALMEGKWLWNAVFCCLARNFTSSINKDLFFFWFEGICSSFERILKDANTEHSYDGLVWSLRGLQELSSVLLHSYSMDESSSALVSTSNEFERGWQLIWSCLVHGFPMFSNVSAVVDAVMILLGNIILHDLVSAYVIPQDLWDLSVFDRTPSPSVMYFISCYFSRKMSQVELHDILRVRKNLLRSVLTHLNWKESSIDNRQLVLLLPAAVYSLCSGCAASPQCFEAMSQSYSLDVVEADDKMEENDKENPQEVFDCSVEVIAKIHFVSTTEVSQWPCPPGVHLPRHVTDPLLSEMENVLLGAAIDMESGKESLSNIFFTCALFLNFIHCSTLMRKRERVASLISKMAHYILELLDKAVNVIKESRNAFQHWRCFGSDSMFGLRSHLLASFKSFFCCPLFTKQSDKNALDGVLYNRFIQSIDNLLKALSKLYQEYSEFVQSEVVHHGFSRSNTSQQNNCEFDCKESRLIDMDLDANNDSRETNSLTAQGIDGIPSSRHWKLSIITMISCFFSVLRDITWKVLFELLEKEIDLKVCEKILYNICGHISRSSHEKVPKLINIIHDLVERQTSLRLDSGIVLSGIHGLLKSLLSFKNGEEYKPMESFKDTITEEDFIRVGELVNKVAENDLLDWSGRIKLVDCICDLVLIRPGIGQTMIERLLLMLQDPDYRVRFCLAQRISVLFQTWDGHQELFQDICGYFGVLLVTCSKEKVVTAKEVLDSPQPHTTMETIIITLGHLAFHSEKIEMQTVFMMCAIAATDPSKRELVLAMLDNLSKQLDYSTRQKYIEELMGSMLFCWVACGVSLLALVEIRQFFVSDAEPNYFLQYCFPWLLPALVIHGDCRNLDWLSKVSGQSVSTLVKDHFVPLFAIAIALHCSGRSECEKGTYVLQGSILNLAQISEIERDALIKKNMVSIVSKILSLTSCGSDPMVPFFSKDAISRAIRTVVDGFMEIEEDEMSATVIDKINIFRPDRVFTFIIELHYKIDAAVHPRHKCHRLAGVEVLLSIIGHRAAISSTSNYLFNLVGQFINCQSLKDQCYRILSALLTIFKHNQSIGTINVLGEQLQFLVSKLVACCLPSEVLDEPCDSESSHILSLLRQLTVDSDPSLYHYVKELEPFPEIEIFDEIRKFHQELCQGYSTRDHFLKFTQRSCKLPPRLLPWSLKALRNKLIREGVFQSDSKIDYVTNEDWHCDHELVQAVWKLVRMCGLENAHNIRELVSDFVSRVGIGDPRCVVFHFPFEDSNHFHISWPKNDRNSSKTSFYMFSGLSDDLLIAVLKLLKKYLMDESVKIVDMTSQALRVILSTERGQSALMTFDSYDKSLMEVHSKGVNLKMVDNFLLDLETKFNAEDNSLQTSTIWKTNTKSFEGWICPLVYSLIGYSSDVILRLCQDVVSCKAELAELLLPSVMVNLAGRKDMDLDLQKLVSMQVQEHIFTESNKSVKSIQVMLNSLNELRLCHVLERFQISFRQENLKSGKPSSYSSKSRSTGAKGRVSASTSSGLMTSTSLWNKVYWLSIDYLIVAKAALLCGSYFTSILYVEHWCKEHFSSLTLGSPEFSHIELLPHHIEILVSAITQINEPDGLYGIIQSHKAILLSHHRVVVTIFAQKEDVVPFSEVANINFRNCFTILPCMISKIDSQEPMLCSSQIITFEHEGNWSKALEYYDLQVRSKSMAQADVSFDLGNLHVDATQPGNRLCSFSVDDAIRQRKPHKGIVRSLQQIGCSHVLDLYCQGLTSRSSQFQEDFEFCEQQYEAAWRAGNWDFSLLNVGRDSWIQYSKRSHFNENLHSCLRALQDGDFTDFHRKLRDSKQELVQSITQASEESTEFIYSTISKLQIFYHLGMAWDLRWSMSDLESISSKTDIQRKFLDPVIPTVDQLTWLNADWSSYLKRTHLHMSLLEPFMVFRRVLLQVLCCKESIMKHHVQSASILRKKSRFSQAASAIQEFKYLCVDMGEQNSSLYWQGRLEEAKLLRAQGQDTMAISLAKYISQNWATNEEASDVFRLVGKWLAETRTSNSRTILEKYLKPSVSLAEDQKFPSTKTTERQSQTNFYLAHYADALFRSYEERLNSNEWQAAMRLRKHKTVELEALIRRLKSSTKGEKTDFSIKIQELQKQLSMDREEAVKLQDDRDNFLTIALEGYKRCLVVGDKYDLRVVFRLISLWFTLSSKQNVINSMLSTIVEVQSYKFIPLVYQIASRMGSGKDVQGPNKFQFALVSLVKKMAIDHPYHTIFQLLALANGDRIKDKQRSRNSFVVDIDKKLAAEKLLEELSSYHGPIIRQMKQMVEIYIKLAELETKKEDTSKRIPLPREMRSLRQLELVPVVTATLPVDRSCQYYEGSFPFFKGLSDTVTIMNGINAPKVVECEGSDGSKYRQLAKSGNDDLRQDAVMEQFFGLVNTFLQNHQDTWKRRLGVRTYKVVPFTPSAGVLEWVDGTIPLGEYLIGSSRNGGAHGRYGVQDWSFLECRDIMTKEKDKRKAFQEVCENFRPVMHQFFLERFLQPAVWFEKRLAYTRSVAASSMVGYIVGLGDRHSMNILIDQATAEVVHIDLGVAFEQGLMLKTPERVPFRLTRDIIDGMGVSGVEGIFRRCCEETLSVMRTNKEALLTIVEVFIHDPLYKWALSPLKALQRQKETDDDLENSLEELEDEHEGNKDAARALMRVKQKLDGYEDGELRSVHGQVQQLIQDATDPERLCHMFPGWGAWM